MAIDWWSRLTAVTPEEQGETLLLRLTIKASVATRHLRPGAVQYAGGIKEVIMALGALAFPDADAAKLQLLEKILFFPPWAEDESAMK